jgi:hypothetical protein
MIMKKFSIPIANQWVGEAAFNRLQSVGYQFPGSLHFPSNGYLNAHPEGLLSFSDHPLFKIIDSDLLYQKPNYWFIQVVSFEVAVITTSVVYFVGVFLFCIL